MHPTIHRLVLLTLLLNLLWGTASSASAQEDSEVLRVFIFAGQSNMVGSDSKVADIRRFPPFAGLERPQEEVQFSYCIGRENKHRSEGWVPLAPVSDVVGPELSFARTVTRNIDAPVAVIKVAAGGTHLGGDWNPDDPSGFEMYPLALSWVRSSLDALDERGIAYRIEGFMWHQGENDMFDEGYMSAYGKNLANFLACWRRDLEQPDLHFFIGELCTKTIWGMDLRPRMHAISVGQRYVTEADPLADYVPTSHVGVEIGGGVGLHYHYGTLGQLEHGVAYADAYLEKIGRPRRTKRPLAAWPYSEGSTVKLFVLAGHRNMEGERAFVQELEGKSALLQDNARIAYRYSVGGGYRTSDGWEPLGPAGFCDTFGPELSLGAALERELEGTIAIAKFTHSGSQIIDWTPEGSEATSRNLYPSFVEFIQESMQQITDRGQKVELAGVLYHVGENDMSWGHFRKGAAARLQSLVNQSRKDLDLPALRWFVSQQPPTDDDGVNDIDVTAQIEEVAAADPHLIHVKVFDLPPQEKKLVLDTKGVVALGEWLAKAWLENR
ncbi:MAG: sialate O-acetylesterase [bacterium]|nr:sialate O-acetylesterase [bacterium]